MRYKIFCLFVLISITCLFAPACDEAEVSKHTHVFEDWNITAEASCTSDGKMERKCTECGYLERRKVQKLLHEMKKQKTVSPDCENAGYSVYACECGHSYEADYVAPLGHSFDKTVNMPDCTKQGYTHYSCSVCNYEFDSDYVKPLAHVNSNPEKHYATVNGSGYTLYTCADCGHKYMADHIAYSDIVSGADVENTAVLKQGIDTSKYNHKTGATSEDLLPLDWESIKAAGVDFVILKAGSSLGKDAAFEEDYAGAKAAGLEVGAYFYAYSATASDTVKDAEMLLGWLDGKQFEYPIYFDLEDRSLSGISKQQLTEMCVAFGEVLQSNGYYAAIYLNNEWLYSLLDTEKIKTSFDVWYARYPLDTDGSEFTLDCEDFAWNENKYGNQMGMWQYTKCGKIEGFECDFDFSYCYKDYFSIMTEWGLNGF